MDAQTVLLKEYELTQQHAASMRSHYWQILGIFMPVNTAAFGGIIYAIIRGVENVGLLTLLFGMVIIPVNVFLMRYAVRASAVINANHRRMQEIEGELGMYTHLMIDDLDNYKGLPEEKKGRLDKIYEKHAPPSGREDMQDVFKIYIGMWIGCIVLALIVQFVPGIKLLLPFL
jgi:hypothetical protein